MQTWDWYPEFADLWHLHSVSALPGGYGYAGVAEYGMTGKIGV
ncbi:isopenicillin acyltransferase, partial [Brevibacterium paucivorans]